jgi:hypothetical protein
MLGFARRGRVASSTASHTLSAAFTALSPDVQGHASQRGCQCLTHDLQADAHAEDTVSEEVAYLISIRAAP